MAHTLAPIDDDFLNSAPLILKADLDLPHSPAQVWEAIAGDEMGSWMGVLDHAAWHSPRPLITGARRSVRLMRLITLQEEYYRWDVGHRATFRTTSINIPIVSGWAEDITLEPRPDGGTRLIWTMAIDNKVLRVIRIPRRLQPAVTRACRKMMAGITTILPTPHPSPPAP